MERQFKDGVGVLFLLKWWAKRLITRNIIDQREGIKQNDDPCEGIQTILFPSLHFRFSRLLHFSIIKIIIQIKNKHDGYIQPKNNK